jgi:hypothetical protein
VRPTGCRATILCSALEIFAMQSAPWSLPCASPVPCYNSLPCALPPACTAKPHPDTPPACQMHSYATCGVFTVCAHYLLNTTTTGYQSNWRPVGGDRRAILVALFRRGLRR